MPAKVILTPQEEAQIYNWRFREHATIAKLTEITGHGRAIIRRALRAEHARRHPGRPFPDGMRKGLHKEGPERRALAAKLRHEGARPSEIRDVTGYASVREVARAIARHLENKRVEKPARQCGVHTMRENSHGKPRIVLHSVALDRLSLGPGDEVVWIARPQEGLVRIMEAFRPPTHRVPIKNTPKTRGRPLKGTLRITSGPALILDRVPALMGWEIGQDILWHARGLGQYRQLEIKLRPAEHRPAPA